LHFDLWWRGVNVAQDAGTYLYNAPTPWENSLTTTPVHNTISVNGQDQMTPAGRFLYLDWVNAYRKSLTNEDPTNIQTVRGRYRGRDYRHTRIASVYDNDRWLVEDEILPLRISWGKKPMTFRLHWLLPDWNWEIEDQEFWVILQMESPYGTVLLSIKQAPSTIPCSVSLIRAGELLHGSAGADPVRGWVSPTYGIKVPALSLAIETKSTNEVKFVTEFIFPK
jgi:hypothetical protein